MYRYVIFGFFFWGGKLQTFRAFCLFFRWYFSKFIQKNGELKSIFVHGNIVVFFFFYDFSYFFLGLYIIQLLIESKNGFSDRGTHSTCSPTSCWCPGRFANDRSRFAALPPHVADWRLTLPSGPVYTTIKCSVERWYKIGH